MTADASLKVLVIILSTTLAVFLVLAIVLTIKFIQVASALKNFTQKASELADRAEAVSEFFEHKAGPMAVTNLIGNILEVVSRKNKRGK